MPLNKNFNIAHLILVLSLLYSPMTQADLMEADSKCAVAYALNTKSEKVVLWQNRFEDQSVDLAMATLAEDADFLASLHNKSLVINRVTFGGKKAADCQCPTLAVAAGGDWGWHIAWVIDDTLFLARMDGAAWVSSVPKRFKINQIKSLNFVKNKESLELHANGLQNQAFTFMSNDEGRSWEIQ